MDYIEEKLLKKYDELESKTTFYDQIQRVKPNYQEYKLSERSQNVITSEGVVRRRGRMQRFRSGF
jgi:hypothetical protein